MEEDKRQSCGFEVESCETKIFHYVPDGYFERVRIIFANYHLWQKAVFEIVIGLPKDFGTKFSLLISLRFHSL